MSSIILEIFRTIKEDYLIEYTTYSIDNGAYTACVKAINNYFLHPNSTRGNGVLCEVLIDMYNRKFGTTLNYQDYCVHHRNGLHQINTCDNIVLISNNYLSHISLHNEIIKHTMYQFANIKGAKPGFKIPANLFTNMTLNDQYLLLNLFIDICTLKTDRKKSTHNIIFATDLI